MGALTPLALYAVLVLVHAALGFPMRQPHLFPDELAYLGQARYLAGIGDVPDMGATVYYHSGYPLLLAPALVLVATPVLTYQAAILVNAFLLSAVFPALYYTFAAWSDLPRRLALAITFTTALYPALLLQSNFAWAENALIPGYAVLLAALTSLLRSGSSRAALLFALVAASLYAVHPRTLALVPLAGLTLVTLSWYRRLHWTAALAGLIVLPLVFLGVQAGSAHFRGLGWSPDLQPVSAASFLSLRTSPQRLPGALVAISGQVLYLAQSTYGVCLVPLIYLGAQLWRWLRGRSSGSAPPHDGPLVGFALLSSLALLATSVLAMSHGGTRVDHLLYGRYNEMFLPFWIALGLVLLSCPGQVMRGIPVRAMALAILAALTAVMAGLRGDELVSRELVAPNIFGIYALIRTMGAANVLAISAVSGAMFLFACAAFRHTAASGLVVVGVAFAAGAVYAYGYCTAAQRAIASRDDVPARIRAMGDLREVSFDIAQPITQQMDFGEDRAERYFSTQFLLPRARLHRFSSDGGETPTAPVVISTRRWRDARTLAARYVTSERGAETALWVLPASRHYFSAAERYVNVSLGWRGFPGVWESGFHAPERDRAGRFRWTDGRATLVVPVNEFPSRLVTHLSPSRPGANVRIIVNGVELWNGPYPAGRRSLDLTNCPVTDWVTIELQSDVMVPKERVAGSEDMRALGVAVRDVQLTTR